jgi:hypothetical protein
MMSRFTANTILLLGALLTGCALDPFASTVPRASLEEDQKAKSFEVEAGKSNIYVYRNETLAHESMGVTLNGKYAGSTRKRTYLKWTVEPGEHEIISRAANLSIIRIDTKPGRNYFIWQNTNMGFYRGRAQLQVVSDYKGRKGVSESKLVDSVVSISSLAYPVASFEEDQKAKSFAVDAGKSNIYVYRKKWSPLKYFEVALDGKVAGKTRSKTYFKWTVEPGEHEITSFSDNTSKVTIDTKPGRNYFIGLSRSGSQLQVVSDYKGRKGVSEGRLIAEQLDESEIDNAIPVNAATAAHDIDKPEIDSAMAVNATTAVSSINFLSEEQLLNNIVGNTLSGKNTRVWKWAEYYAPSKIGDKKGMIYGKTTKHYTAQWEINGSIMCFDYADTTRDRCMALSLDGLTVSWYRHNGEKDGGEFPSMLISGDPEGLGLDN